MACFKETTIADNGVLIGLLAHHLSAPLDGLQRGSKHIKTPILEEYEEEPMTRENIVLHYTMIGKPEAAHLIGKKGDSPHKIEDFCGVSLNLTDYEIEVETLVWCPL